MKQKEISEIFKAVLKINTRSRELLPISHTIHLISFNAQIAAAHTGESGRTLSVMTHEINMLAPAIAEFINTITSTINDVAQHNANCMNRLNQLNSFSETERGIDADNPSLPKILESKESSNEEFTKSCQDLSKKLHMLRPVFSSIGEQIKSAEMIGTLLRIEVARGTSTAIDTGAFQSLADELTHSCIKMQEISKECNDILQAASILVNELLKQ